MATKFAGLVSILSTLSVLYGLFPLTVASPSPLAKRAFPPFGQQIYGCTVPDVLAVAFDDGPWIYTDDMLDK